MVFGLPTPSRIWGSSINFHPHYLRTSPVCGNPYSLVSERFLFYGGSESVDNLRSKVIRLAYANPDLRGPLLGVLKAGGGPRAGYEIHVSASYRDYHKDPQAPVQTHNLGPRSLAFIRLDITEAKLTKSMVDDIVRSTMRDWSSKLGTGGVSLSPTLECPLVVGRNVLERLSRITIERLQSKLRRLLQAGTTTL